MELKIKKTELIKALHLINSITDKSSTKPILSNFLLKTLPETEGINGASCVEFSATDYEISLIVKFEADIIEHGELCVSAKKVYEITKEFIGEDIHINSNEQLWMQVTAGNSKLKLPSVEVGLYPKPNIEDLPEKLKIKSKDLKNFVEQTLFAAQTNEARRNLMGVNLKLLENNQTRWLATDGHRLAQVISKVSEVSVKSVNDVIIPRKALHELSKSIENFGEFIDITFNENLMQFKGERITFKTQLLEGKFPNCDPIIPKDNNIEIKIDKERFNNSLKIVSLISLEKLKPIKVSLSSNNLKLDSEKAEYGEASDSIEIEYAGDDLQIGFNARYLLDVLSVIRGNNVILSFKNSMSPCLIKDDSSELFLSVIMPLRIEW